MNKELTEEEFEQLVYKAVNELYEAYQVRYSLRMCVYLRPSEDMEEHPGKELTKEEFMGLCTDGGEWTTAYDALFKYIVK
jgi:hypothetical protein